MPFSLSALRRAASGCSVVAVASLDAMVDELNLSASGVLEDGFCSSSSSDPVTSDIISLVGASAMEALSLTELVIEEARESPPNDTGFVCSSVRLIRSTSRFFSKTKKILAWIKIYMQKGNGDCSPCQSYSFQIEHTFTTFS